jgi:hypothetical protein
MRAKTQEEMYNITNSDEESGNFTVPKKIVDVVSDADLKVKKISGLFGCARLRF